MVLPPSRDEVNELDRLRRILDGERPAPTHISAATSAGTPSPEAFIIQQGHTAADTADMANIMKNYSKATGVTSFKSLHTIANDAVISLVNESQDTPELREALITEKTDNGVRIGAWEITKHKKEGDFSKSEVYFRVHNINTGKKIKAAFLIAESAQAVVKLLNNGVDLSHPTIKQIATFEIEYRQVRKRALEEKKLFQRARKTGKVFRQDLYEAKFDAAKLKALLIRERVINLYNQIR